MFHALCRRFVLRFFLHRSLRAIGRFVGFHARHDRLLKPSCKLRPGLNFSILSPHSDTTRLFCELYRPLERGRCSRRGYGSRNSRCGGGYSGRYLLHYDRGEL